MSLRPAQDALLRSYLKTPRGLGIGVRRNALGGTVSRTDTRSEPGSSNSVFTLALDTKPTAKAVKGFDSHLVSCGCFPSPACAPEAIHKNFQTPVGSHSWGALSECDP